MSIFSGLGSDLKQEALLLQLLILHGIEAEELGGAVGAFLVLFLEGDEEVVGEGFFAEVAFVEGFAEDGFVETLELGEGEFRREQLEADGLVGELATEAGERGGEDVGVIEGERWEVADGEPFRLGGIRGGGDGSRFHEGEVGDADDALSRIAFHGAEGVELLQEVSFEAGFLLQLAAGGVIERFLDADEATGQGPLVFEGGQPATDEQYLQFAAIKAEDNAIDRQRGAGKFISVRHTLSKCKKHTKASVLLMRNGTFSAKRGRIAAVKIRQR